MSKREVGEQSNSISEGALGKIENRWETGLLGVCKLQGPETCEIRIIIRSESVAVGGRRNEMEFRKSSESEIAVIGSSWGQ
jgi:hypothetical protein